MTARHYSKTAERIEGQTRSCVRLSCRGCGVQKSMVMSGFRAMPNDVIERKFGEAGWTVGTNENWDFCPACTNRKKDHKVALKVVDQPLIAAVEKPREMGRDDRRLIFAKLDEVYLDEKRGYDTGWSDHKVATDLGVPRKWVEIIRAENFGAIGTNEDMQHFLTEAEALVADARKALQQAKEAREACEVILKNPAFLTLNDISGRVAKVEKLAGEVRKLVVTP